jgi:adenine phosphoribosyltransferase
VDRRAQARQPQAHGHGGGNLPSVRDRAGLHGVSQHLGGQEALSAILFATAEAGGDHADLARLIRAIPDFPKPGILFRDVTTLLLDPWGFGETIARLAAMAPDGIDLIAGIEARGFVFAAALAREMGCGLLLLRKSGKLPGATVGVDYALEYGTDRIEMHADACVSGRRVWLIDDLIATGGTALAAARLIRDVGGVVAGAGCVVDLPDLGGADRLRAAGVDVQALLAFPGH